MIRTQVAREKSECRGLSVEGRSKGKQHPEDEYSLPIELAELIGKTSLFGLQTVDFLALKKATSIAARCNSNRIGTFNFRNPFIFFGVNYPFLSLGDGELYSSITSSL